jgi:hypothetical protein
MTKAITKKAKRAAKRLFARKPHSTRAFTSKDYQELSNAKN